MSSPEAQFPLPQVEQIQQLINEGNIAAVSALLVDVHPADIADLFELLLHFDVTGEVERLEFVDELHEAIEGLLMDALGFSGTHRAEHFFAEPSGLLAQFGDTFPDECLHAGANLTGGGFSGITAGETHLLLLGEMAHAGHHR